MTNSVTPPYQGFSQLAGSLASKPWSKKDQNHLFETLGMTDFSGRIAGNELAIKRIDCAGYY
jgi:hypothetical protein